MFFDIGANVGKWSLTNINLTNKIISVEASLNVFDILKQEVKDFPNIVPLNYAVCNSETKFITFYNANTLSTLDKDWLTSINSRFYNVPFFESQVETISIDKLIETYGIPDLIKVDVEGAENIVLKSLTKKIPVLCFEWASEWFEKNVECLMHLKDIGYTKFHIQYEDSYSYRPPHYEHDINSVINELKNSIFKVSWGMIWCI